MRNEADRLLGESPVFLQVLDDVSRAATLNKPVLMAESEAQAKKALPRGCIIYPPDGGKNLSNSTALASPIRC